MKKTLIYCTVAVVAGLVLTLVPLAAYMRIETGHYGYTPESLPTDRRQLSQTSSLNAPEYVVVNVEALSISFVIALVVYLIFRSRMLH